MTEIQDEWGPHLAEMLRDPEFKAAYEAAAVADASDRRVLIALAWHDVTCPEGPDCRDRFLHAWSAPIVNSGHMERFLDRLAWLEES